MVVNTWNTPFTLQRSGHRHKILSVAWNCNGSRLASGGFDGTTQVFSCSESRLSISSSISGHRADVDVLSWHPSDELVLATASADKSVRLWDIRTPNKPTHIINTIGENINIAWAPDGNCIAVGNKDDVITFIDPRGGRPASVAIPGNGTEADQQNYIWHTLKRDYEVNEIKWDYTGSLFYLTTGDGTVQVLDFPSFKPVHIVNAHTSNCYCIEFDPIGRYMAVGSSDSLVSLWDLNDMPVRAMSFTHCGEFLASAGTDDKFIEITNIETGESMHTVQVSTSIDTLAWHPSKYMMVFAGENLGKSGRNADQEVYLGMYSL